ncbi:FkbM family methyltransferase [Roseobacter sp. YSTF-M11]|uniref:FkbM family methyltransferase n=1 Tax=Roseobacter insulae TaxID=2859783 RepID=A0A9X1FX25_9RHOB|nr:FkbM family methyltransferase [Roseobacter insulae]MBW4709670.1 FkbM family methyltransferase [Roseobacter insulae]
MLQDLRRTLKSEGMVAHPIKTRAPYLRGYGFDPGVVFDVGVDSGTPWLYRSFPQAQFVLIDPQQDSAERVRAKGHLKEFHFHAAALGAQEGKATLMVPHSAKGEETAMASLLRRTDPLAKSFTKTDKHYVPVRRLDDIAVAYPGRAGLKVDTEGSELEILKGAHDTLKRCDFVILELSLTHRFAGVGAPSEAVAILAAAGLEWRDVLKVGSGAGKRARPRYMDVLFTRWLS